MKVGTDGVLLGAWAQGGNSILDIGTGTGLLALMMAQRYGNAHVVGIDAEAEACSQAKDNVSQSAFADRINIELCRFQSFWPKATAFFDAIVCNPPYYTNSLKNPNKSRSMARHADSLPFDQLAKGCSKLLSKDGALSMILPTVSSEAFKLEATVCGLFLGREILVSTVSCKAPSRVLLTFFKRHPKIMDRRQECLFVAENTKSAWYEALTNDFYLS